MIFFTYIPLSSSWAKVDFFHHFLDKIKTFPAEPHRWEIASILLMMMMMMLHMRVINTTPKNVLQSYQLIFFFSSNKVPFVACLNGIFWTRQHNSRTERRTLNVVRFIFLEIIGVTSLLVTCRMARSTYHQRNFFFHYLQLKNFSCSFCFNLLWLVCVIPLKHPNQFFVIIIPWKVWWPPERCWILEYI